MRKQEMVNHQEFTAEQLEKMIADHVRYWARPGHKSDIEAEAARVLVHNYLPIAQQLLAILKAQTADPRAAERKRQPAVIQNDKEELDDLENSE